jgi:hypothetical protein
MRVTSLAMLLTLYCIIISAPAQEQFNGTTYLLDSTEVKITQPVNGSGINLSLYAKASSFRLVDSDLEEVPMNYSITFKRGDYIHEIKFDHEITGYLSYILPTHKQRFIASKRTEGPVKLILPAGYDTGDPILGRPRPKPDNVSMEGNKTVLIWEDPFASNRYIEVNYYTETAPRTLRMFILFLFVVGVIFAAEYFISIKRLRSIREEMDEEKKQR